MSPPEEGNSHSCVWFVWLCMLTVLISTYCLMHQARFITGSAPLLCTYKTKKESINPRYKRPTCSSVIIHAT